MAKNKKQDRKQPQSARGARQSETTVMESPSEPTLAQASPGDIARKGRQKRFGHN
ncbi:hypothetical protein [Streptomyces sp. NPDC056628]|uniref:hypothetical protein n=1 Tax=Streptomyces sp. NPDC056628 TaxID=3345882 RepID=UPI003685C834